MFKKPKPKHLTTGEIGEQIACEYLIRKGYRIVERNFRRVYGEIDIIARHRDDTLVFVEVKTMSIGTGELIPEDNISESKMRKTKRICEAYANQNSFAINEKSGWRIDVLAIELSDLTDGLKDCVVRHYENV